MRPGALPLATLVARLSRGPARLLGLPGGSLAPGAPADVTILDLEAGWTVDPARFQSKSRNTPFGGLGRSRDGRGRRSSGGVASYGT